MNHSATWLVSIVLLISLIFNSVRTIYMGNVIKIQFQNIYKLKSINWSIYILERNGVFSLASGKLKSHFIIVWFLKFFLIKIQ